MMVANALNDFGRTCQDKGHFARARAWYAAAAFLAPGWAVPWFNRGLIAKFQRRWKDSAALNRRAAELDPDNPPTWWNLGIAATATGDWPTARQAWSRFGIDVPAGEGPIDMDLGIVPIRVSPLDHPEVVWCDRLDPARATIRSVPTPDCGRGYGDTVLHDGEPKGSRNHQGREVPVFDELQLLEPGTLHTFSARVVAPAASDVDELAEGAPARDVFVEDWQSSIRWICARCSEGSPDEHEHPLADAQEWKPERTLGVAAATENDARAALQEWTKRGAARELLDLACVLARTRSRSAR
jgi:tetratricopeptide (TPR) repeat protein